MPTLSAVIALSLLASTAIAATPSTTYLDIQGLPDATTFAVQVCVGLFNRDDSIAGAAYTLNGQRDTDWLECTGNNKTGGVRNDPSTFLRRCLHGDASHPALAKGHLRYNFTSQQVVVPNIATLAGVLDAVPLDDDQARTLGVSGAPLLDLIQIFPYADDTVNAPRRATEWVYDRYLNLTTGMAKMNPGLDVHGKHKLKPPLTKGISLGLVDFIVKRRLFNFFLNLGCVPLTDDNTLMKKIATKNPWARPITVYGYDDTMAVAGDLFEAETDCVHDLGQVASNGCSNLAFYSRKPAVSQPVLQVPDPTTMSQPYNTSQTYITVIIGDGDNVNFVKGSRYDWMKERVQKCQADPTSCLPLAWSLSPALLNLAPDWLQWYYEQAFITKQDWFVLPPSGHTYSYPGEMDSKDQANFVKLTEQDAHLMNLSGTVHWEFSATWGSAIKNFFPQYAANGIIQACFAVNVPFPFPVLDFKKGEHYKLLSNGKGGQTVLFAPREWRGNGTASLPLHIDKSNVLSPQAMAAELNGYPKGTVSHIYTTSDGGFNLDQLIQMISHLDEHVKLVSPNEVAMRAIQRG